MEDEQVIQALSSNTAQKAFTDRVGSRCVIGCGEHLDATRCRHPSETGPKLAIMIANKVELATWDIRSEKTLFMVCVHTSSFPTPCSKLEGRVQSKDIDFSLFLGNKYSSKGEMYTVKRLLNSLKQLVILDVQWVHRRLMCWTKPSHSSLTLGVAADLFRSKPQLVAENALLRQQLIILKRQVKRPACTKADRIALVLLARVVRTWKQALFIIQPETLLRWHREGFRRFWKRKSQATSQKPKGAAETVALIKEMATKNRLWGAERIRGGITETGYARLQANHPEVHQARSRTATRRTEVGDVPAQSRSADLGL
jgi:hypothetical protein